MPYPLILSRLIESGFIVWTSLEHENIIYLQREDNENKELRRTLCLSAATDGKSNPIARVVYTNLSTAILDKASRTVWLLPESFCSNQQNLRLGESLEQYILPEPSSASYLEQKAKRIVRAKMLKAQIENLIEEKKENQ